MLHFVTSYMKQNKSRKQTLESAQSGLEISFKGHFEKSKPKRHIFIDGNVHAMYSDAKSYYIGARKKT